MIHNATGNLLEADAEALVNTVNSVGYMGKGIALQFKKAFPANFDAYHRAAKDGEVRPGRMFVHETGGITNPKYIINFPTKQHWRGKSRMEDIEAGLEALAEEIAARGISSIAIPPLGCGLGGLDWEKVRPKIEQALAPLQNVDVFLYAPQNAPEASDMPVGTTTPRWTPARAQLIKLMDQYLEISSSLTLLEIQKLAYFLQEDGESLRLRFKKAYYGPYAENLNKVLERIEGHFTRGYGDNQKPDQRIDILPGAAHGAEQYLNDNPEAHDRLKRVTILVEGFETPYGMELLTSIHWVAHHDSPGARDVTQAIEAIRNWNPRKRRLFREDHMKIAWDHLNRMGYLPQNAS